MSFCERDTAISQICTTPWLGFMRLVILGCAFSLSLSYLISSHLISSHLSHLSLSLSWSNFMCLFIGRKHIHAPSFCNLLYYLLLSRLSHSYLVLCECYSLCLCLSVYVYVYVSQTHTHTYAQTQISK
jgi:hypothetical protein